MTETELATLEGMHAANIRQDQASAHWSAELVRHVALRRAIVELFNSIERNKEDGNNSSNEKKRKRSSTDNNEHGGNGSLGF